MRLISSRLGSYLLTAAILCGFSSPSFAGSLRERLKELRAQHSSQPDDLYESDERLPDVYVPAGVSVLHDISYGSDPRQCMDIYLPSRANRAPVIVMVHGGGWRRGDKRMASVVQNKMVHWTDRGYLFVPVNYRMLPQADVAMQAHDVATALAAVQHQAATWGGDPQRIILIGHSAGAHLAALISASPSRYRDTGLLPWQGTVSLDSGALDVPAVMRGPHMDLFDAAFGADPDRWQALSPLHALQRDAMPILAVCSSKRRASCSEARRFAARAKSIGVAVTVLPEDLSHRDINDRLGTQGAYTQAVERFIALLRPAPALP